MAKIQWGQGISAVNGHQIQNVPQVRTPQMGAIPQVRGRYAGYSDAARAGALRREQMQAPGMQAVGGVQFDPYTAQGISGVGNVSGPMINMQDVPDVGWQGVDPAQAGVSPLQAQLNQQAMSDLALGGQLSAEDLRGATQQARSAFADRGMGRSNAAIFGEALNRDIYSRQRQSERRGFAQGVEQLGLQQRMGDVAAQNQAALANAQGNLVAGQSNQQMQMQGQLANQATGLQAALANQQMDYNVGAFNAGAQNQAGMFNAQGGLQAAMSNQGVELARAQTQYQGDLQTRMANQQAMQQQYQRDLQAQMANQQAGLSGVLARYQGGLTTGLANQGVTMQGQLANQATGLQAAMANQGAQLQKYEIDQGIGQQQRDFRQNAAENRAIYGQNMADLQMIRNMFPGPVPLGQGMPPVRPRPITGGAASVNVF